MRGTLEELALLVGLARDGAGGGTFQERAGALAAPLRRLVPFSSFVTSPLLTVCTTEGPPGHDDAFVTPELLATWRDKPAYFPHYFAADPRQSLFPGRRLGRIAVPPGRGLVLTATLRQPFGRDAFTGEYMGFTRTRYIVDVFVDRPDGRQLTVSLLREGRLGDFSRREVQLLELVAPEVARLNHASLIEAELGAGTDERRLVLLVDDRGEVVHADDRSASGTAALEALGAPVRRAARACLDELSGRRARRGDLADRTLRVGARWVRVRCGLLTPAGPRARAVVTLTPLRPGSPELAEAAVTNAGLSAREREVAALVVRGHSDAEVARALGVAVVTVKAHLRVVYRKLGVRGRTGLAAALLGGDGAAR